jgi:hypothetical protein
MRIRYPDHDEITDPTPELPADLQREIKAIITGTVAFLRTTPDSESGCKRRLSDDASRTFGLLNRKAPPEDYGDVDLLQQVLTRNAELALSCMHFAYNQAGFGRMLFLWHAEIVRRLDEDRQPIVTACWVAQAEANPVAPTVPAPIPTRAPRTTNAFRIEHFIQVVWDATAEKNTKKDIWLVAGYHSDKEFRLFQAEKVEPSSGIARKFNAVLKLPPGEFIKRRDIKREEHEAHLNAKSRR